ncbi:hypothetical protein H8S90_10980 [Olivibacter sp. SDN3]|uniref:O-antigen ligase family protein n=1 Tax=Olivibacter sp. SDN3 TaxID=2764720 RepID=UPI0016517739|nr:O-antigen ligase family protein [Olivibacter sp. SDN3]QNL52046.1 hypothetical protein H8S90_10980 [Olivibacter sp. SDN3]
MRVNQLSTPVEYELKEYHSDVIPFYRNCVNFMVLFFPLLSFLLVPAVQGTTVTTVIAALLFGVLVAFPAGNNKAMYIRDTTIFFMIFMSFSIISQFLNLIYDLKLSDELVLVNRGSFLQYFFRPSHITQSLYIIISFIIFLFVKYYADRSVVKYIYWALRLLCFYAIYEFVYFKITGGPGDFMTNRKFGDRDASLFQTTSAAGIRLMRMKGYTGEPSMFAFTILPFWALTYGLKRRFDNILLLVCLILTFSTTAYFSIILFNVAWFIYKKRYRQIFYVLLGALIILAVMQLDAFRDTFNSIYNSVFDSKISGDSVSSRDRGGNITTHFEYWMGLGWLHQLFGIGFGYVRSTDFLTTILVNNGLVGFIVFSCFVGKHFFVKIPDKDLAFCYAAGLAILYFIMLATVPEFAYPSLWIYLGVVYVFNKQLPSIEEK